MSLDIVIPKYLVMTLHVIFLIFKENATSAIGQKDREWSTSDLLAHLLERFK